MGNLVQVAARHADARASAAPTVWQRGPAESPVQVSATHRADPDADQDGRQQQRENRADTTKEDSQVTEPDDLHSHRGEAG